MAHALKTGFRLSAKRTSPFKSAWASGQSTTGSRGVRISGSNAAYTMFRGSVKGSGYPLHSPVSPSLPLLCVTVCHHISTGLYSSNFFCTSALGGGGFSTPRPGRFAPQERLGTYCIGGGDPNSSTRLEISLISNFCRVLNVVYFVLGNSPASEFYMPTFRNILSYLHRQVGVKDD
jgi:hypothetical protein